MTIFLNILFLLIGFVLLVKGADYFVEGACSVAEKFGIPQIVIGLTIVAMGTSLPEAAVSISAAINGSSGIAIGNVLGSNITNVVLILGICALITPLIVQRNTLWYEIPFVIVITVAMLLLGIFDSELGRLDGGILIILFALFFVYLIYFTLSENKKKKNIMKLEDHPVEITVMPVTDDGQVVDVIASAKQVKPWVANVIIALQIVLGGVAVVAGGQFVVSTTTTFAEMAGIPDRIIGLTIVALGTSLPELVTSVIACKKGNSDLAIGNIVGSNIFNILFVLGITALISPIAFASEFLIDALMAIAVMIMLFVAIVVTKKKQLGKVAGGVMIATYVGYTAYLVINAVMGMNVV